MFLFLYILSIYCRPGRIKLGLAECTSSWISKVAPPEHDKDPHQRTAVEEMDELCKLKQSMTKVKECSEIVESFIDGSKQIIDSLINNTKVIADFSKHARTSRSSLARPSHVGDISDLLGNKEKDVCELHINGFDSEQIWQEIEISNDPLLNVLNSKIRHFCKNGDKFSLIAHGGKLNHKDDPVAEKKKRHSDQKHANAKGKKEKIKNLKSNFASSSVVLGGGNDDVDDSGDLYDAEQGDNPFRNHPNTSNRAETKNPTKISAVDDGFFVLDDMNRYLDFEDKREMRMVDGEVSSDAEDIDYFGEDFESADDSNDEGLSIALKSASKSVGRLSKLSRKKVDAKAVMYADFFDQPVLQKNLAPKKSGSKKIDNGVENPVKKVMGKKEERIGVENEITKKPDDVMEYDDDHGDDDDNDLDDDDYGDDDDNDDDDAGDDDDDNDDDDDVDDDNDDGNDISENDEDLEFVNGSGNVLSDQDYPPDNIEMESNDKSIVKSRFEKESLKMQKTIKEIEAENVAQKPWQLTGEATAAKRPKNSLLEENLHFDQTLVAPPTVTEETTETLEQMIMQRIKDQAWDDVARKVKPVEKPFEYKRSLNLDQEKSKLSLAEIYEKEYVKQTEDAEEEEKNPDHEVIEAMMKKLFSKLDALSNFQYTPKEPKPELKIVSNLPSVAMEENTPITVSNAAMLAPEEVYDKKKKDLKGHDERTTTDRKRERREKKTKKREMRKNREKKLKEKVKKNPGMVLKGSKKSALESLKKNKRMAKIGEADINLGKSLKSSTAFFTHLQENVSKNIRKAREKTVKSKKESADKGEKYKL